MNIRDLTPPPLKAEPFRRSHSQSVPTSGGCYVLTDLARNVLYIGLTVDLRRRLNEHLDSAEKT